MAIPRLTPELLARVAQFSADFHRARIEALRDKALGDNPYQIEKRDFGSGYGIAYKIQHPLLRGKNRINKFEAVNLPVLEELLDFYRSDGLPCALFVPPGQMTQELFERLVQVGMWSAGSGTVLATVPEGHSALYTPPYITVRVSGLEEKEQYLDLFQEAFGHRQERSPEYRAIQWAEDALPGGVRYIAEIDGKAVGMASFIIQNGIGHFGTAGVLPEFRGRGVQVALIHRRIYDAPGLGCDLVLAGGNPGTTTYRNFERASMSLIPTGMSWGDRKI